MKNLKKFIFCIFSLTIVFTALVFSENGSRIFIPLASAAENGTWGDNLTWTLTDDGTLTLSGTGEMQSSSDTSSFPWLTYTAEIKSVIIGDGITSVASKAFYKCEALTDITVSKDVTAINSYAFYTCPSLTTVTLPENSSLTYIYSYVFAYCSALEYIYIPSSVEYIGSSAFESTALKTVDIPADSNLKQIQTFAFSGTDIEQFYVPSSVTTIFSWAFKSNSSLKEITVSENNGKYTAENGVLFNKEKTILEYYPAAKTDSEYTVPAGVKTVSSYAFYKNQYIVTLNFPETLVSLEKNCCENMQSLEYVNFAESTNLSVITEYAFFQNASLKEINIPAGVTEISVSAFSNCTNVNKITFAENSKLEKLGSYSFGFIKGITQDIILPASLKTIGYCAFYQCNLNNNRIIIPQDSLLETIGSMAFAHVRLYENTFFIPSSVKTINSSAFSWSSSSSTSRHIETLYYGGSEEQWNLIDINETNPEIFSADIIFDYNTSLYENITMEENGTVINIFGSGETPSSANPSYRPWNEYKDTATAVIIGEEISTLGKNSFADFSELTYIIIRTPDITIEDGAFNNCPKLETVIILGNSSFTENAFVGCAENIRIFEEQSKQHTFSENVGNISVVKFTKTEETLVFEGTLTLDSYEFFDVISVFATEYENIAKLKLSSFAFEDIVLYRYDEENMSRVPIDNNTVTNGEIYPQAFVNGELKDVTFNELCEGMADGNITDFYLITVDENSGKLEDTQVEVKEEQENFFLRAIRWVVTLINKLFRVLKSFFG